MSRGNRVSCYEDMLATIRHLNMSRWSGVSLASRACCARGIWRTTRQTDRLSGEVSSIFSSLRGCYTRKTAVVEFRLTARGVDGFYAVSSVQVDRILFKWTCRHLTDFLLHSEHMSYVLSMLYFH